MFEDAKNIISERIVSYFTISAKELEQFHSFDINSQLIFELTENVCIGDLVLIAIKEQYEMVRYTNEKLMDSDVKLLGIFKYFEFSLV